MHQGSTAGDGTGLLSRLESSADVKRLSAEQLSLLAGELRSEVIRVCAIGGGHLASSLGAVELTVALHHVFDSLTDRFIWDVGHQSYAHKMLTGRREQMDTIRKPGGLAGFTTTSESPHDALTVGHASTSLAAALGMALARDARRQDYAVIPVIGDGALTGGMALAALNQIGHLGSRMLIILNDNEMSISENVGGLNHYMRQLQVQDWFQKAEKSGLKALSGIWQPLADLSGRAKDAARRFFDPDSANPFHAMGVRYVGPVDGHDIEQLVYYLKRISRLEGPTMLHLVTRKGKGWGIAEEDPVAWHGPGRFNPEQPRLGSKSHSWSDAFGTALEELVKFDERVWAITPAMREGSGLTRFSRRYPGRFVDVGIAEDVAVTVGTGLALRGEKPVIAIYSTFLQRAVDQVIHDVALENLDVIFAIDRAGLVGADGMTHQGVYDISILRSIPNLAIGMPRDAAELRSMLKTALKLGGPRAIRWPRGGVEPAPEEPAADWPLLEWGSWEIVKPGSRAHILAAGPAVASALEAAEGVDGVGVVNARFIKPLDEGLLRHLAETSEHLITVEDHVLAGGFGSAVLEFLADCGERTPVSRLGIRDRHVPHGNPAEQHEELGYGPEAIRSELARLGFVAAGSTDGRKGA